jgi:hypothetical protein
MSQRSSELRVRRNTTRDKDTTDMRNGLHYVIAARCLAIPKVSQNDLACFRLAGWLAGALPLSNPTTGLENYQHNQTSLAGLVQP